MTSTNDYLADESTEVTEQPLIPRMGVKHLMLWMLFSSIGLAMSVYALQPLTVSGGRQLSMYLTIHIYAATIVKGGVFAGALTLAVACWRHQCLLLKAPGHWIAAAWTLASIISVMLQFSVMNQFGPTNRWLAQFYALSYLSEAVVYGIAVRFQSTARWRVLFVCLCIFKLGMTFIFPLALLHNIPNAARWIWTLFGDLTQAVVLVVAFMEMVKGLRYDWIHVVTISALAVLSLERVF